MTKEELIKVLEIEMECYNHDCEYEDCEDCPYCSFYSSHELAKHMLNYLKEN